MRISIEQDFGMIKALWLRDMIRLVRERTRWIGVVIHPLLVWLLFGYGLDGSFGTFQFSSKTSTSYLQYFYPGIMVMSILFTTIYATMSIIEDRSMGFLQAVLVAPGSRNAMVFGKILGVTTIGLIQSLIFLALAPWAGYSILNISWGGVFLILSLGLMGFTAMNFSFAWIINSTQGYHAIMNVLLLPLWMLSGALFPSGPPWLQNIMAWNPMTYVVSGLRFALHGQSENLMTPLLVLFIFSGITFLIAGYTCRRGGYRTE